MRGQFAFVVCLFLAFDLHAKMLKLKAQPVDLKTLSEITQSKVGQSFSSITKEDIVIQFQTPITDQTQKDLGAAGFEVLQYLPDDALIVYGSLARAQQFQKTRSDVYTVAPYLSDWKLSEDFNHLSVMDQGREIVLQIRTLPKVDSKKIAEIIGKKGGTVLTAGSREILVRASPLKSLEFSNLNGIEYIQKMPEFKLMLLQEDGEEIVFETSAPVHTGYESGTKLMKFEKAWDRGFNGAGQIVAMSDTGLDTGVLGDLHQDLTTVMGGKAMPWLSMSWADSQGHGTHVAGSVVGQGTLSNKEFRGGAFGAKFYAQGIWNPLFKQLAISNLDGILQNAYEQGARIHTNSWGGGVAGVYDIASAAADEFMFYHQDMLVLFAAGNEGVDLDKNGVIDSGSISSPGTAKNVLTVGASENLTPGGRTASCGKLNKDKWGTSPVADDKLSDNPNGIACFSSRGPTRDGRTKPDVVAPGTNIVSLHSRDPRAGTLWGLYGEEGYAWAGGTSMATPLVAGAAAVIRQYLVSIGNYNPSAALVKAVVIHTSTDIFPGQFSVGPTQEMPQARPNSVEGYGRVNVDVATNLGRTEIFDEKVGVAFGETRSFELDFADVPNLSSLRATLVYTDAPASASSGQTLVNNLDLEIVSPDGKKYSLNDTLNPVEMLEVKDLSTGKYTLNVKGVNVPQGLMGRQPYAVVVSPLVKSQN